MAAVDWSDLPPELLGAVSSKLPIYSDYLRFRAVCRSFRSSVPRTPRHLPTQLPWLLLPADSSYPAFFNLQDRRVHNLRRTTGSLSPLFRRRCLGSSHGWIATVGDSPEISLVNPLTLSVVALPPLTAFPGVVAFDYANVGREYAVRGPSGELLSHDLAHMRDSFVEKIVLSSGPNEGPKFVAVAVTSTHGLTFCRSSDTRWASFEGVESYSQDVTHKDGSFYALHKSGQLAVFNLDSPSSSPEVLFVESWGIVGGDLQYLVFAGEDLLRVLRHLRYEPDDGPYPGRYRTDAFDVLRLEGRDQPTPRWVKMKTLGDYMLFLGRNSSLALRASEFPSCIGNCIHFTDDYLDFNADGIIEPDMGIYRMWDGTIEVLPSYAQSSSYPVGPQPIWLSPNPC